MNNENICMELRGVQEPVYAGFEYAAGMSEYMLVLRPDGEVCRHVRLMREELVEIYGAKPETLSGDSLITIASLSANDSMEGTLLRWLQRIFGATKSFTLALNNFSGIPPHTIYLRVQDPYPLQELARQLKSVKEFIDSGFCLPPKLVVSPHLCLAGKLTESMYRKAMLDFSQRTYHAEFPVDQLMLLKRDHAYDIPRLVTVFGLSPVHS